jgi:hypothetical protein
MSERTTLTASPGDRLGREAAAKTAPPPPVRDEKGRLNLNAWALKVTLVLDPAHFSKIVAQGGRLRDVNRVRAYLLACVLRAACAKRNWRRR